jgi:hypothetical protein
LLGFDRVGETGRLRCLFNLGNEICTCAALKAGRVLLAHGVVDQERQNLGGLAACVLELPD